MKKTPAGTVPHFDLGDRLEKALRCARVSHAEMADYLGVSRNTVGNYVHMRTPVTEGTLRLWSMRTGIPLEWLASGKLRSRLSNGAGAREPQVA